LHPAETLSQAVVGFHVSSVYSMELVAMGVIKMATTSVPATTAFRTAQALDGGAEDFQVRLHAL
jgi:hypothetical protein